MSAPQPHGRGKVTIGSRWLLAALAALFCLTSFSRDHHWDEYFYVYSVWKHSTADLIQMELALSDGLFPSGFFSAKLGFVLLLDGLADLTGAGQSSLALLRGVFCALTLGWGLAMWLLARELMDSASARKTALVALFLPLPLYLGFKLMSEVPSLLLATLGGWQFVRGLELEAPRRHVVVAAVLLALASITRMTTVLFLPGLVTAVALSRPRDVPAGRLVRTTALVLALQFGIIVLVYVAFVGTPLDRFGGLAASVTSRRPDPLVAVYGLVMFVQCFLPALAAAALAPAGRPMAGALAWLGIGTLPFVLASDYLEPRFFVMANLPLAMLAASGLDKIAAWVSPRRQGAAWIAVLAATVTVNRIALAPIMPHELQERDYSQLVHDLEAGRPGATYVTPWLADFCYLAYAFPANRVVLSLSDTYGTGRIFGQPDFKRWVANQYVGNLDELARQPRPWLYVGWDYNPTVRAIDRRLRFVGVRYLDDPVRRGRLLNHLTPSWIWTSAILKLDPIATGRAYQAFEIVPRTKNAR
jgi:hypothetical protein